MRLLSVSVGIVCGFALGAWCISRLLPAGSPAWFGLSLCVAWLFLLILAALRMSSKYKNSHDQSRLFRYATLAATLMAAFLVPLFAYKISLPKLLAEAVLAAIGGAVFLFSNYMERRKMHRTFDR